MISASDFLSSSTSLGTLPAAWRTYPWASPKLYDKSPTLLTFLTTIGGLGFGFGFGFGFLPPPKTRIEKVQARRKARNIETFFILPLQEIHHYFNSNMSLTSFKEVAHLCLTTTVF
jgi:hypothetical protein